jgi:hypothetical protein
MTTPTTRHVAALALSLVTTIAVFSGVAGLSSPSHANPTLAKAAAAAPRA